MVLRSKLLKPLTRGVLVASLVVAALTAGIAASTAGDDDPLTGNKPCASTNPVPATTDATYTKFLIMGDSLVHQSRGDYTWRYFLYKQLVEANVKADFVGDYDWVIDPNKFDWPYCDYVKPAFDSDHTSESGGKISGFNQANQFTGGLPWIQSEVQNHDADVAIIVAGANDIGKGSGVQATVDEDKKLVDNARAANPDVDVVIATIPVGGPVFASANFTQYNNLLKQKAPTWSQPSAFPNSKVAVAQIGSGWGTAARTNDHIHPNVVGDQLVAQGIANALHSIGIGAVGVPVNAAYKVGPRTGVSNFVATRSGSTVNMSWKLPPGASGTQLMARDVTGGQVGPWKLYKTQNWQPYDSSVGCPNPNPPTAQQPTIPCNYGSIPNLAAGRTFQVDVHAIKGLAIASDVWSTKSGGGPGVTTITMPNDLTPTKPTISSATAGHHQVTLSWTPAVGTAKYGLRWRAGSGAWKTAAATVPTSRVVKPLTPKVRYEFQIRSVTGSKVTAWSASKFAVPKANAMATPAKPVVKQVAGPKARVTWKKVVGANRYLVQYRKGAGAWKNATFVTGAAYTSAKLAKKASYDWRIVPYDYTAAGHYSAAARIVTK